jgi:hypothetical protein
MKIDVTKILLIVLIVIMGYNTIKNTFFKDTSEYDRLRREIITSSELVKLTEGRYEKLLNDYNSEKDLLKQLKESNKLLYENVRKSNEKVIAVTRTMLGFKKKIDSIILNKPLSESIKDKDTLEFYYPTRTSPLIKHSLLFTSDLTAESYWDFTPTPLDLVITETERGIYKANIGSNPYVKISSLDVDTLPFETKKDKDGWSYGAGIWRGEQELGVDLYGGVRLSQFNILLRLQPSTNPQVGAALIYNPK